MINALRFEEHDSHLNVEEALRLVEVIGPKRTYLTHMSHEMGLYAETNLRLPEGVELAYDTLEIELTD